MSTLSGLGKFASIPPPRHSASKQLEVCAPNMGDPDKSSMYTPMLRPWRKRNA
jgi:hypothetical protein